MKAVLLLVLSLPLIVWAQPQLVSETLPEMMPSASETMDDPLQRLLDAKPEVPAYPHDVHPGLQAEIRILDFNTNRFTDKTIQVKEPYTHNGLRITLQDCRSDYKRRQQDIAWLDIETLKKRTAYEPEDDISPTQTQETDDTQSLLFRGWMFNTHPAAHALEHPAYDVRLLKCA